MPPLPDVGRLPGIIPQRCAVTVESSAKSGAVSNTKTQAFTCTAATALFITIATISSSDSISVVSYNGTDLTQLWSKQAGAGVALSLGYMMVNPSTGSNNVIVTFSASTAFEFVMVALLGTDTSSVAATHRTVYTASDVANGPSVTVADSQSGDLVIDGCVNYNVGLTVGAGQTVTQQQDSFQGSSRSMGSSTESASGANTVMSWTATTAAFNATGATALIAASTAASAKQLAALGVG